MNEIDQLYQLPLAEFTQARNDLAKRSKEHRAEVGKLQKPGVAAWAVNQLYWHRRPEYDALIHAAEQMRTAQAALMSGRPGDVTATETAHRTALKAAAQQIRQLLSESGESASPMTMTAVSETLQALPSTEPPGRLTRPLKPMGLEALTRLLVPGGTPSSAGTILPFTSKARQADAAGNAGAGSDADAARRDRADAKRHAETEKREAEAEAQARETKKLDAELREARGVERAAETAAERARAAASAAEAEHQQLIRRIEEAADEAERLRKEAAVQDRAVTAASVARQRVEARLKAITP